MYADNTMIFIGLEDDPAILQKCLDIFCEVSTVRFNDMKMEIIPMGSEEQRNRLIQTRDLNGWTIPIEIQIAKDSKATRILGSWQGNGVNVRDKWNDIIERQSKTMNRWSNMYPSMVGQVLIVQALVISLAQYLMTVNGISRKDLMTMEKNIRTFIWNGKRGQIAWERVIQPIKAGGVNTPSAKIRYETIKVGWLKRWWCTKLDRPDWAKIANEIMYQSAHQKPNIARSTIKEWICQTWLIKSRLELLPKSLKEMIKAAQKYNIRISVMRALPNLRLSMPAFHHPFKRNRNLRTTSKVMKCLQKNHKIRTVVDLIKITLEKSQSSAKAVSQTITNAMKRQRSY